MVSCNLSLLCLFDSLPCRWKRRERHETSFAALVEQLLHLPVLENSKTRPFVSPTVPYFMWHWNPSFKSTLELKNRGLGEGSLVVVLFAWKCEGVCFRPEVDIKTSKTSYILVVSVLVQKSTFFFESVASWGTAIFVILVCTLPEKIETKMMLNIFRIWYLCHTFWPCLWCYWHRLLGTKWQQSVIFCSAFKHWCFNKLGEKWSETKNSCV